MGYQKLDGQWANVVAVPLVPSGAHTTTFDGDPVELGDRGVACLTLDVTVRTGTAVLDVAVKTCDTIDGSYTTVASFSQASSVSSQRKSFVGLDRFVMAVCTIGGSGSVTFSVDGDGK